MYRNAFIITGLVACIHFVNNAYPQAREPMDWVQPFTGIGTVRCALPEAKGIATRWSFLKPCEGHLHPGATLPFGMVSAVAYSGGFPTGYAPNSRYNGIAHFQVSGTGMIGEYYNFVLVSPTVGSLTLGKKSYSGSSERASPGYYSIKFVEPKVLAEVSLTRRCAHHRYTFESTDSAHVVINLSHKYGSYLTSGTTTLIRSGNRVLATAKVNPTLYVAIELPQASLKIDGAFAYASFAPGANRTVEVKIGFSLVSTQQALANLSAEIGSNSFTQTASAAAAEWNRQLGRIKIAGGTDTQREIFYTALYHSLIKPIDLTGEHKSGASYDFYRDFATLWDIYNTQIPLVYTFYPERGIGITKHLANRGPYCCSENFAGTIGFGNQGKVLSHRMIADAFLKKFGGIDYPKLKNQMKSQITSESQFVSRGEVAYPVHTLDLAYGAYCTAVIAKGVGDEGTYGSMKKLAANWINAYSAETGVMDGTAEYYEGGPWNYSFAVWHDMQGLIKLNKGNETFLRRLDAYFGFSDPGASRVKKTFSACNNENDLLAPYAYLYAGRPDRTQTIVRDVMKYRYNTGMGGLAGNDDSGGLSAWYVLAAIGLQPVLGQNVIWIGSPIFDEITFTIAQKPFTVRTMNNSDGNRYIQSAELDASPLNRPYISYEDLRSGGLLELTMGNQPSSWGQSARPPSWLTDPTQTAGTDAPRLSQESKHFMRILNRGDGPVFDVSYEGAYSIGLYDIGGRRIASIRGNGSSRHALPKHVSGARVLVARISHENTERHVRFLSSGGF